MAQLENELAWKLAASLADRIGDDRYELYFDDQTFQFEHGTLLVQAANEFSLERISSQFQVAIAEVVALVLGTDVSVAYVVAGQARVQQSLFGDEHLSEEQLREGRDPKGERPGDSTQTADYGDAELVARSNMPSDSDATVEITTAAISLDSTVSLPERRLAHGRSDTGRMDQGRVANQAAWESTAASTKRPSAIEGDGSRSVEATAIQNVAGPFPVSDNNGSVQTRLAPKVKRELRDQENGQLSLFGLDAIAEAKATPVSETTSSGAGKTPHTGGEDTGGQAIGLGHGGTQQGQINVYANAPAPGKLGVAKPSLASQARANETGKPCESKVATAQGSRAAMSLASFQFGKANRLAQAAANQVLQQPGSISPVVLHGPVGCGKTHLATGIGQQLRRTFRSYSVLQLSAEQFTSRFLEALNGSGLPSLRAKFRDMDLLILEDIQFFQGKKATIVELQHTLDALIKAGKQLILTSDRHPNDLTFLGSEVQTRLVSGLVVGLLPADREARADICRQWCARQGLRIDDGLVDWLADHIVGDVRRLSGALFRVLAMQSSTDELVTAATAMDLLSDYVTASHSVCSLGQIQKVVCDVCGVDVRELNGSRRTRKISGARMLAMFLARKHTQAALSEIGDFFGGRRHSTVLAAEKRIKSWASDNQLMETGVQAVNTREVIRKVEAKLAAM